MISLPFDKGLRMTDRSFGFPGTLSQLTQSGLTAWWCKRTRLLSGCGLRPGIVLSLIVMCDRWFKKLAAVSDGLTSELPRDRRHAIVTAQGPHTDPPETHTAETTITGEDFKQIPTPHACPLGPNKQTKTIFPRKLFSFFLYATMLID